MSRSSVALVSISDQGSATVEEGAVEFGHDSVFGERRVKPTSVTGLPQRCDQPLSDAEGEAMTPEDVVDEATFERALDTIGGLGQQIVHQPSVAQAVSTLGLCPQSGDRGLALPECPGQEGAHVIGVTVGQEIDNGGFVCRPPWPQLDDP